MRLPNFLVVGAPKAGTTAMHHFLSEHPEIYLPSKKELHYFTYGYLIRNTNGPGDRNSLERCCADLNDYKKHYQNIPDEAIAVGEASPSYLFFTDCIPKIKELLGPNVKILIMLRNPIERAFSMYSHLLNAKREHLSFFDALQAEEQRAHMGWGDAWLYKAHSLYYEKVLAYMNAFSPENVKVILHHEFKNNAANIMQSTYRFLGVDPTFVPWNINIQVYSQTAVYRNRLAAFLAKPQPIKAAFRKLLPGGLVRQYRYFRDAYLQRQRLMKAAPDPRSVHFLHKFFASDIAQLESQLHLPVHSWK